MSGRARTPLSRGGRALGIAAVAVARGQRPGEGPWHALAPDLVASAEEIMTAVAGEADPAVLAAALEAALGPDAASAAPSWLGELDDDALRRIAAGLPGVEAPPSIPGDVRTAADAALWILALAFCRNPDAVAAVGERLGGGDRAQRLARWSRLAQVVARPGEPSRTRRQLKALFAAAEAPVG